MADTKEAILRAALRLFARDGYEAVSVSRVAGALGMTKSALYKHFKSKRDIFDSIVARMERLDAENARQYSLPQDAPEGETGYADAPLSALGGYTAAQFDYWTRDAFAADFRRLLTLEQYRNEEMAALYQQYLAAGPLKYVEALFREAVGDDKKAAACALAFYAPVFLLYSVDDGAADKDLARRALKAHIAEFFERFQLERGKL